MAEMFEVIGEGEYDPTTDRLFLPDIDPEEEMGVGPEGRFPTDYMDFDDAAFYLLESQSPWPPEYDEDGFGYGPTHY